jgi:outer membrane beta-barrel protein
MTWSRILALTALAAATLTSAVATPARAEEPIDHELAKYWNVEQAVPSLQNPLYERKGGFEGSLHFGVVPNDSFYLPYPVGARLAYFLTDTVSIEAGFSYLLGGKSALQTFLECPGKAGGKCTDLTDGIKKPPHMTSLGSLDLAWVPLHGKVGIFTQKLTNFDLGISGGVGLVRADIDTSIEGETPPAPAFKVGGHWGAGFRFYLTRFLNLRLDYKQFAYKPGATWLAPVEFTLGVAFLTK